jgi:prepilin-type N-terminal cleavage/methylation domain-containing protein
MSQDLSNSRKGFSLIELMIAVVFFGIIATTLSVPISNTLYLNTANGDVNTANSLARSYLEDLRDAWKIRNDFDQGNLIVIEDDYTEQGKYTVTTKVQSIQTDVDGNVLVRRVNVVYKDRNGDILCDISLDFDRPGNVNQSEL